MSCTTEMSASGFGACRTTVIVYTLDSTPVLLTVMRNVVLPGASDRQGAAVPLVNANEVGESEVGMPSEGFAALLVGHGQSN